MIRPRPDKKVLFSKTNEVRKIEPVIEHVVNFMVEPIEPIVSFEKRKVVIKKSVLKGK